MSRQAASVLLVLSAFLILGVAIGWRVGQLWPDVHAAGPLMFVGIAAMIWAVILGMKR